MELYGYEIQREKDLSHHGILGQRWGKKNGPPYPLDTSDHSASEKKAGWRKSLSAGTGNIDSSSKKTYNSKKLTSEQKKRLIKIGAAVAIGIVAAGTVYYVAKSGNGSSLIQSGKDAVKEYGNIVLDDEGFADPHNLPLPTIKNFPNKITE